MVVIVDHARPSEDLFCHRDATNSFVNALHHKYIDQVEFDNQHVLPKDRAISTDITFVGFGKVTSIQKQLNRLTSIDVSKCDIAIAGDTEKIRSQLDRVKVLNLAENCLSWLEVVKIIECLPNLQELILTGNPLKESNLEPRKSLLYRLHSLTLGRVPIELCSLVDILSNIWYQIEQIDLWDCNLRAEFLRPITDLNHRSLIAGIKTLKVSHNNLYDFKCLEVFGESFQPVELDLSSCELSQVTISNTLANQLKNLKFLNISYNQIRDWACISELYKLKSLYHLICHENPIFLSPKSAKLLTIGRLASLKQLNREEITRDNRRDSDIYYLKSVFNEMQSANNSVECLKLHPRYTELTEIYGIPEDLKKVTRADKFLNVELQLESSKVVKKLPSDMRVANVKMLCKKLFNMQLSSSITLECIDPSLPGVVYKLDQDGQTLHHFSIKSGQRLKITLN